MKLAQKGAALADVDAVGGLGRVPGGRGVGADLEAAGGDLGEVITEVGVEGGPGLELGKGVLLLKPLVGDDIDVGGIGPFEAPEHAPVEIDGGRLGGGEEEQVTGEAVALQDLEMVEGAEAAVGEVEALDVVLEAGGAEALEIGAEAGGEVDGEGPALVAHGAEHVREGDKGEQRDAEGCDRALQGRAPQSREEFHAEEQEQKGEQGVAVVGVAFALGEVGEGAEEEADEDDPALEVPVIAAQDSEAADDADEDDDAAREDVAEEIGCSQLAEGDVGRKELAEDEEEVLQGVVLEEEADNDQGGQGRARQGPGNGGENVPGLPAQVQDGGYEKEDSQRNGGGFDGGGDAAGEAEGEQPGGLGGAKRSEEEGEACDQENGHDEVALSGEAGAVAAVEDGEEEAGEEAGDPVDGAGDLDRGEGEDTAEGEIVDPPGEIAAAEEVHGGDLDDVGAGHVAVSDVVVGLEAVVEKKGHVVHDGGVPDDGPVDGDDDVVDGSHDNGQEQKEAQGENDTVRRRLGHEPLPQGMASSRTPMLSHGPEGAAGCVDDCGLLWRAEATGCWSGISRCWRSRRSCCSLGASMRTTRGVLERGCGR